MDAYTILKDLWQAAPSVAAVAGILLIAYFIVKEFKAFMKVNVGEPIANIKKEIDDLRETMNKRFEKVEARIDKLTEDFHDLKERVIRVESRLEDVMHPLPVELAQVHHSPTTLSERGEYVFKACGGKEFLERHKEIFFNTLDEMNFSNAYDLEQYIYGAVKMHHREYFFEPIKKWLYTKPTYTWTDEDGQERAATLTIEDVCAALAIPLRYMYLEARPNIVR